MRNKKILGLSFLFISLLFLVGCSEYQEDFTFTGTVEEIVVEYKILVMKEYDAPESRKEGNVYEIPVDKVERYNVGQKLEVTVFSNIDVDVWDLDHMKFEIEAIDN